MFKGYLSCKIKWIQIANLKKVTLGMSSLGKKYDTYRAETWHAFRKVVCLQLNPLSRFFLDNFMKNYEIYHTHIYEIVFKNDILLRMLR